MVRAWSPAGVGGSQTELAEEGMRKAGGSYGQLFPDGRQRVASGQRLGAREDVWAGEA